MRFSPVVCALALAALVASPCEAHRRVITAADTAGYAPPVIANGHTGIVISKNPLRPVAQYSATAFSAGTPGHVSTIIPVIRPLSFFVDVDGKPVDTSRRWSQTLDMDSAMVTTRFSYGGVDFSHTILALRSMPFVTMASLTATAVREARLTVACSPQFSTALSDTLTSPVVIHSADGTFRLVRATGRYDDRRSSVASSVAFVPDDDWHFISPDTLSVTLRPGQTVSLWTVAATCTTADFADPANEAERQAIYAMRQGREALLAGHASRWNDLWKSDVEVEGDSLLREVVTVALYSLYSSVRPDSPAGVPPMGLSSDKYSGHVFWDADTWMLPVFAVLHPGLARSMVDFRVRTLPAARRRAVAYGYRGAMFPWEADHRGEEATPTFALTGPLEHHITADVARGAWISFRADSDTLWLRTSAYPLMRECADFWVSRVTPNPDGSFSIRNVVGADEYAIGVDDNAFTNAVVRRALEHTADAAEILGLIPDPRWRHIASRLRFHRFPDSGVIKTHAAYSGAMTKQADVELLAYPLGIITDPDEIDRTVRYYEEKIDSVNGPAMSHSAMSVNYMRMGRHDKARRLLDRAWRPYVRGPFHSIAETPSNGATYFLTGAAGLLQSLIFGYADIGDSLPENRRDTTVPIRVTVRCNDGDVDARSFGAILRSRP